MIGKLNRIIRERGAVSGISYIAARSAGKIASRAMWPWRRAFHQHPVQLEAIETVMVVKLYGIGNMILFTPALQALRKRLPEAKIILLTDDRASSLIEPCNYYDEKIILPVGIPDLDRNELYPCFPFRIRRKHPDLVITSFPASQPGLADMYDILGAKWSVGHDIDGPPEKFSHRLRYDPSRHEVLCNLDLLSAIGIDATVTCVRIELRDRDRKEAEDFLARMGSGPWFGFHCGSFPDMKAKRWPIENFAKLGDLLAARYRGTVIIFGGDGDRELAEDVAAMMKAEPVVATGRLSLLGSAAAVENCRLMVSNDSGLMHLAAAVGTPLVALFGPTSTDKNSPWTAPDKARVVKADAQCSPCFELGMPIKCEDPHCMRSITVERVWEAVQELLGEKRA